MSNQSVARGVTGKPGDGGVNVQVILRCRPPSKEEIAQRTPQVVKCSEPGREVTLFQNQGGKSLGRTYHFDRVFPGDTCQEKLYLSAVSPIVDEVLEGFNCTIFAYGQTGTGKTYTMQGGDDSSAELSAAAGVIPRAVHQIFCYLDSINSEYTVKCSFLELYNEEITDLLVLGADTPKVRILEDRSGVVLHGLEEVNVKSSSEIFQLLDQGSAKRRTAETLLNKQSSRSHSVFTVTVSIREILAEGEEVIRVGKLYLVDLAGSENISRSGAIDQRAKEAGNINKSLLTLGRVITALVEGQGHIPYRDSKLTRLLRDSLGGKTKTCIIATIAPTVQCQEETLSTLDYAHRAKNIKNKPEVNQKISKTTHLKELNTEIEKLKQELYATREKNGVYLPAKQYEEECEERRQLTARVELLEQEAEKAAEHYESEKQLMTRQAELQRLHFESQLKKVSGELQDTKDSLQLARRAIAERDFLIATQQQCESSIADHANSLTSQLHAAAADISLLFARIDEKNSLEDSNMGVVKELNNIAVQRLAAFDSAVSGMAASQCKRFEESREILQSFLAKKKNDAIQIQQQMVVLQTQLAAFGSTAEGAVAALQSAGQSGLQEVDELNKNYVTEGQAAARQASTALTAAYRQLSASIEAEQTELSRFAQEQASAVNAVFGATSTIVSSVRNQLLAAKKQANAAQLNVVSKLGQHANAISEFEDSYLSKTKAEQAELINQIAAMVDGFVNKTEQQVKNTVCTIQEQIAADQQSLGAELSAMEVAADSSLQLLQDNEACAKAAFNTASEGLERGQVALAQCIQGASEQGQALEATILQHASISAEQLAKHAESADAAIQQQAQALANLQTSELKKCSEVVLGASTTRQAVEAAILGEISKDEEAAHKLDELTTGGARQLEAFASKQQAEISELAADVRSRLEDKYRMDAGRDSVPQQRERQLPTAEEVDAMRTPPVEEVLEAYREQQNVAEAEQQAEQHKAEIDDNESDDIEQSEAENAEPEEQENMNKDNLEPVSVDLPAVKTQTSSPKALGKRTREMATPVSARPSPSKLRGAFERSKLAQKN